MNDLNRTIIAKLDDLPGAGLWDVIPGQFTPATPECGSYPTALAAHDRLVAAGYEVTSRFVATPPLHPTYDRSSVVRYAKGDVVVVLARRAGLA